jgi:hypothetical protein
MKTTTGKEWLDNAATEKQCPSTPVNVPAHLEPSAVLLMRITVSGDKLYVEGTGHGDHIVIEADIAPGFVQVEWEFW